MAKKPSTIAITGANGFVGSALVSYFAAQGWSVVALVRKPESQPARKGVRYAAYNLLEPLDAAVFQGVDVVVHAAYVKQDKTNPNAFQANVSGAEKLLQASRQAGVAKTIFISSMSSHEAAQSSYGKQKFTIEKLFTAPGDLSIRPGLVVGNGGIVQAMVQFMKSKHLAPLLGGGHQPLQPVSPTKIGEAIASAVQRGVSGVVTVASVEVYSYKQFYKALADASHTRVLFVPLPLWALLAAAGVVEFLHLPLGVNRDNVMGLKKLIAVDTAADLARLNLAPETLDDILADVPLS
ncbi:MAG: NAD-dependent epimerase/dehydratase [Candidatus Saccharibacteria bacterium]|nr:NAD-dependent epimerase/dehydratase [Candidatus Saccharibacteria bacterium]